MEVLHGLMSRLNIMRWMIYLILESREDHTMRLTENGDTVQPDELSSQMVMNASSRYASLDIQPTQSS